MNKDIVYYVVLEKDKLIDGTDTEKARFLLAKILNYFKIEIPIIVISKSGKPLLENSNIFFNYSHCDNYIACAVSLKDVGIDILETSRIVHDTVAKRYLENEQDELKRIEKWVRKEAYSKLKGSGFNIGFQNIHLEKIKNANYTIVNNQYICSIYVDDSRASFQKIDEILL